MLLNIKGKVVLWPMVLRAENGYLENGTKMLTVPILGKKRKDGLPCNPKEAGSKMYIYNITCRIPEIIMGLIFKEVVSPEEIHHFLVKRDLPINEDSDLSEIQKLAQDKFGGKREVKNTWHGDFEWEPEVQVTNISYLGAG